MIYLVGVLWASWLVYVLVNVLADIHLADIHIQILVFQNLIKCATIIYSTNSEVNYAFQDNFQIPKK